MVFVFIKGNCIGQASCALIRSATIAYVLYKLLFFNSIISRKRYKSHNMTS